MLINMPSGLIIEARSIGGPECIELAERANTSSGSTIGSILRGCWQKTIDPGSVYEKVIREGHAIDWDKIYKTDLMKGLYTLRGGSVPVGDVYEFQTRCEDRDCREAYPWRLKLSELEEKPMSDSTRTVLEGDGRFTIPIRAKVSANSDALEGFERKVTYKLLTASDDEPIKKLLRRLRRNKITYVESLTAQTVAIEGLGSSDINTIHTFYKNRVSYEQAQLMRYGMDEHDFGVDTDIKTKCPHCGWEQDCALPLGRSFFLQPRHILEEFGLVPKREKDKEEATTGTTTTDSPSGGDS